MSATPDTPQRGTPTDELKAAMAEAFGVKFTELGTRIKEVHDEFAAFRDQYKNPRKPTEYIEGAFDAGKTLGEKVQTYQRNMGLLLRAMAKTRGDAGAAAKLLQSDGWGAKSAEHPVVKTLLASSLTTGGSLVVPEFSDEIIPLLRPMSVVMSLNPNVLDLPEGGLTWGKTTAGVTATYEGENTSVLASQPTTGQFQLMGRRLSALTAISNRLLRGASVSADQWVAGEQAKDISLRGDLAFIRGDGLENTPKGLRNLAPAANQLTSTEAAQADPTVAEMVTVTGGMWLTLRNADIPLLRPGYLMAPRTARVFYDAKDGDSNFIWRDEMNARGTIDGIPFRVTTQIETTYGGGSDSELYLADFSELIVGEEQDMIVRMSDTAAYYNASGVIQAPMPKDESVVMSQIAHDIGAMHEEAIVVETAVAWNVAP